MPGIFSVQDTLYFRTCNPENDSDIERIRLKLKKYTEKFHFIPGGERLLRIVSDPPTLRKRGDIRFEIKDNWLKVTLPQDDALFNKLKKIKGWKWDAPFHFFPSVNSINVIRTIENEMETFLDFSCLDSCAAGIGIFPESKIARLVIFIEHPAVQKFMSKFRHFHDLELDFYDLKIEKIDDLYILVNSINSSNGIIKFVGDQTKKLKDLKKVFDDEKEKEREMHGLSSAGETSLTIRVPDGLKPYPFQVVGVKFIEKTHARTILSDEMGLGKTIQSILFLYNHPEFYPVLLVCPLSTAINWKKELKKWAGMKDDQIEMIRGTSKCQIPAGKKFYIVNYEIVSRRIEDLLKLKFKILFLDEAHYIKNYRTSRAKACFKLADSCYHAVCLDGTPIMNRPVDIWSLLVVTRNSDRFGGFWKFAKDYCDAKQTKFGWDVNGSSNLEKLQLKLRSLVMIRRLKRDVLPELPEKRRMLFPVEITNRAEYDRAMNNFRSWHVENYGTDPYRAEAIVKIERLKQIVCKGKVKGLMEMIEIIKENVEKMIVFFHHKDFLSEIGKRISERRWDLPLLFITSDLTQGEREETICEFKQDGKKCLLCSIDVCGIGVNLQGGQALIFTEFHWNPAIHDQAEDRAHRIGMEKELNVYYVFGDQTIEENILMLIDKKREISANSIGGGDITDDLMVEMATLLSR